MSSSPSQTAVAAATFSLQELRKQQGPPKPGQPHPGHGKVTGSRSLAGEALLSSQGATVGAQQPAALQARELFHTLRDEELGSTGASRPQRIYMADPIFGPPEVPSNQLSPTPCQMLGLCCCPCCVLRGAPGLCCGFHQLLAPRTMEVWRRIIWRAAVWCCLVDIVVFIVEIAYNGGFEPLFGKRDNPMLGPSINTLLALGAKDVPSMVHEHQWWRAITPMILHIGVLHLFFNVVSTFRMGLIMEEMWGTKEWLAIYIVSGVAGSLSSCAFRPETTGVGASGSLFGLLGAWLFVTIFRTIEPYERRCSLGVSCIAAHVIGLGLSAVPYVDWTAHFGGWLAGFVLAAALVLPPESAPQPSSAAAGGPGGALWKRLEAKRDKIILTCVALMLASLVCYIAFLLPVKHKLHKL